jgi:hypothetical protein
MLHERWRLALRSRPAGGGSKPPQAAPVKHRGGERCGKGVQKGVRYESRRRTTVNRRRSVEKNLDDVKTEDVPLPWDKPGMDLRTAQAASGIKAARARLRLSCGTWEPAASTLGRTGRMSGRTREGDPQAAETARGRVPERGAGTDRPVVARKPGNAGGAKGAGYPGLFGGQPRGGRSR